MTAAALALAPVTAHAQFSEPGAEAPPDAMEPEGEPFEPQEAAVAEGPEPAPEPAEPRANARTLRRTGVGLMTTGGVVAASGLGLTIAFTVIGDRRTGLEQPVLEDIEQANRVAQIGGILLASGLAVIAVGGIIYTRAGKARRPLARYRVMPAMGGLVVSGQF